MREMKRRKGVRILEGMLHESERESKRGHITVEQIFESFYDPIGYAKSV